MRCSATGMTMAIDPGKVDLAKQLISEFNRKMCELMGSAEKSEVYELNINFFPVRDVLAQGD